MPLPSRTKRQTRRSLPPVWLFDLDNTLHDANTDIFPAINRQMVNYLAEHLQIEEAHADRLRLEYWQRFGATLHGVVRSHRHIDPEHFLRHTHVLPHLRQQIRPMHGVRAVLDRLPGRKLLFTNGPLIYAVSVLRALQIEDIFDGVVAIQHSAYHPKPQAIAYRRLLKRYRLDPRRCIMVEDTLENLETAKRLGMRTVWISRELRSGTWADHKIRHLRELHQLLPHTRNMVFPEKTR